MSTYKRIFLDHVAQTSDFPMCLEVDYAQGMYIFGTDGKKYLDFNSGISVSSLGHCYPEVVAAIQRQSSKYMHTMVYGEHIQKPQVEYAELVSKVLGKDLDNTYFLNSGTEAVELAIKISRKYTGRQEIISCANAYHGSTLGAESLRSDYEYTRNFFPTIPGVRHIAFNDITEINQITTKTAAIILEPVQAEAGIFPPQNQYLQLIRQRCDETKTLMVLDEIQTGFGRTGHMFAFQKYGVKPDIILMAKGMGGGMPISALTTSKDIMSSITRNPMLGHITTFGGHPVCVAAALATLKTLLAGDYVNTVENKESLFKNLLVHPLINEVRSSGLMIGIELNRPEILISLIEKVVSNGVLVDFFLFNDRSFRIAPPLIISEEQIHEGVSIILKTLDEFL